MPIDKRKEAVVSPEEKFGRGYARLVCKSLPTLIQLDTNAEISCIRATIARDFLRHPNASNSKFKKFRRSRAGLAGGRPAGTTESC
jgi:hypothetical protein